MAPVFVEDDESAEELMLGVPVEDVALVELRADEDASAVAETVALLPPLLLLLLRLLVGVGAGELEEDGCCCCSWLDVGLGSACDVVVAALS